MLVKDRLVVPSALADELLDRSDPAIGVFTSARESEHHRLDVLAGHLGGEQTSEIQLG